MLANQHLVKLASYVRSKIDLAIDPATLFTENPDLKEQMQTPHKGLYIGIVSSTNESLAREGFLKEGQTNVLDSTNIVVDNLWNTIKKNNVDVSKLKTSTFHFSIISDCIYMPDPTAWDENNDGIYFMWGQKYRGLYLSYQIKSMNLSKTEVLDRLCSWEIGIVSSVWKQPCGLVWRLVCQNHVC